MSILLVLGLIPLVGSAVVAVLPAGRDLLAKQLTLAFSLATLAVTIGMCAAFDPHSGDRFQFTQSTPWIRSLGLSFALGVDGIALVLIALVAVLTPAVVIASWHEESPGLPARQSPKIFFALLLLLEVMLVGVFAATDVLLFYVFFEAMLVPMYFLIGSFGGPRRQYAAIKFFLYSLLGGLLMLAAVIGLYVSAGKGTFAFSSLLGAVADPGTQKLLFLGFFVAFAIKAPLVPFHTWLPDAGAEAPVGGAALLVGVLDKVGTFGFIRYCLPLFPDASRFFAPLVLVLSVVGILYAALLAMGQKDMKRLVAYTSVAHFGFIGLGIFAFTTQGLTGATFYMVNHGLSTGALFLVVGLLIARGGSRAISDYGGVAKVAPLLGGVFLITGLSVLALPGMSTFISEFLVLVGTFTRHRAFAVVATVGIILAALYVLLLVQRTMHGPPGPLVQRLPFKDLSGREAWAVAPLLALVILFGVYPKPVLDVITPAVQRTMHDVKQTDPAPTTGVAADQEAGNR
jgi:NADH-quinone oxidoreductase subunit M